MKALCLFLDIIPCWSLCFAVWVWNFQPFGFKMAVCLMFKWIVAFGLNVRTLLWDRQCRKNGREEGPALSKPHHSLVNDTLLSFSHTILPFPPSFNPSQIKHGVIHSSQPPGGQESTTTPSRVHLTARLCVHFPLNCCPGAYFSTTSSPQLCVLSCCLFVWCQSRGVCAREVFFEPGGRFITSALLLWCKSWKVSVCSCH